MHQNQHVQLWCTKELLFILASHKEEITPRAEVISGSHLWCTARLPPSSNREKWQTMYVSSVTTMNQLKKCWVSYLRRFSPIVRHHICCLDLVYWLQRKASLKHVHKHILMNFRNNLHFLWLNFADIYLPQGLNLPWGQYIKFKGSFVTCFIWWQLRLNFLHL